MTPYKFGDTSEVRYAIGIVSHGQTAGNARARNEQRSGLSACYDEYRSHQGPACFDLQLQPRTDPAAMPIEDATAVWSEKEAPFITVAPRPQGQKARLLFVEAPRDLLMLVGSLPKSMRSIHSK
jgi:hypothetical protein